MASPSDLAAHYSTLAFRTRLTALTSTGLVLGADIAWAKADSSLLGCMLVLVVASLAELNRRYTHAYLTACSTAAWREELDDPERPSAWREFMKMNERHWSLSPEDAEVAHGPTARQLSVFCNRFLLSWSTYLPGMIAGLVLLSTNDRPALSAVGAIIAALSLGWWVVQVRSRSTTPSAVVTPEEP